MNRANQELFARTTTTDEEFRHDIAAVLAKQQGVVEVPPHVAQVELQPATADTLFVATACLAVLGGRDKLSRRLAGIASVSLILSLGLAACTGSEANPTLPEPQVTVIKPIPTPEQPPITPTPEPPATELAPSLWQVDTAGLRVADLVAPGPEEFNIIPDWDSVVYPQLVAIEAADPRCGGTLCDTLVAVDYIDGELQDARVQYLLTNPQGDIYVLVRNADGTFNLGASEWVPHELMKTADGRKLKLQWIFDFDIDPKTDQLIPAATGETAISRLVATSDQGNVEWMWIHQPGDGITQLLVKDPRRYLGPEFGRVDGKEFVVMIDGQGEFWGGYFPHDETGKMLLGEPATNAGGDKGMWQLKLDGGKLTAVWQADAVAPTPTQAVEDLPAEVLVLPEGIGKPMSQEEMRAIFNSARRLKGGGGALIPLKMDGWDNFEPGRDDYTYGYAIVARSPKPNALGYYYGDIIMPFGGKENGKLGLVTILWSVDLDESQFVGNIYDGYRVPLSGLVKEGYVFEDFLPHLKRGDGVYFDIMTAMSQEMRDLAYADNPVQQWKAKSVQVIDAIGEQTSEVGREISGEGKGYDGKALGPIGVVGLIVVGK